MIFLQCISNQHRNQKLHPTKEINDQIVTSKIYFSSFCAVTLMAVINSLAKLSLTSKDQFSSSNSSRIFLYINIILPQLTLSVIYLMNHTQATACPSYSVFIYCIHYTKLYTSLTFKMISWLKIVANLIVQRPGSSLILSKDAKISLSPCFLESYSIYS